MSTFQQLNIIPQVLGVLNSRGYSSPTPIQEKAIPAIMKGGDVFACAQTGTGKTAAFAVPILQMLHAANNRGTFISALVVAPTRELAQQIGESFNAYGKGLNLSCVVVYGGVSLHRQADVLKRKTDILVATPGRLIDLVNQRIVKLDHINHFVLDEADRMLDMGFIDDIKKIISKLPPKKQSLLFAATASPAIKSLARTFLKNPLHLDAPGNFTDLPIKQLLYYVGRQDKLKLLCHLMDEEMFPHALVFTRTKRGAEHLAKDLSRNGIQSLAIHGDKSQSERQRNLASFKSRKALVLVATDVASRGIDIKDLTHVINYDMPQDVESYIHRIGRTGRAGSSGIALSFCEPGERPYVGRLSKIEGNRLETVKGHPFSQTMKSDTRQHVRQGRRNDNNDWKKKGTGNGQPTHFSYKRSNKDIYAF